MAGPLQRVQTRFRSFVRSVGRRPAGAEGPVAAMISRGPVIQSAAGTVQATAQQASVALGAGIVQAPTGDVVKASPSSLVFRTALDPQAEQREFRTTLTGVLG